MASASEPARLSGITWDHTRGYLPMVATAQRFGELHPEVAITWRVRSLKAFGDQPLEELAPHFDLLVIDHPFVGLAATRGLLLPLDEHLPAEFLADQAANSVGASHASYAYGGHQWALAIDAATPVSSWRPDLLERAGARPPETWEELLQLARRGLVAVPAVKIDSLMHVYMLCIALGEEPFQTPERVASPGVVAGALETLRELLGLCDPACLQRNPIRTYEALAEGDGLAYCPFAYGYSNYARPGYARHTLRFGGLVTFGGRRLRSTLGGTGLAVSASCAHPEAALAYARYVASPETQRGLYVQSGGQPGHRAAWEDEAANALCGGFFRATLQTLDEAFLRPRFNGYDAFQDRAADLVHAYLRDGGDARGVAAALDALYRDSMQHG
ncbi:MAG TPA: extracellular solute-binding protein [Roseiflexaceae bacterium]|nr:extracellular solute-binding protein [Roseiflexaceae bacterium]